MELVKIIYKNNKMLTKINECVYSLGGSYSSILGDSLIDEVTIKNKCLKETFEDTFEENDLGEWFNFFALIDNGRVVAKACVFYKTREKYAIPNKRIYISSLGVLESLKHQGYGTTFMKELFKYFDGYQIVLGVEPRNDIAYNFYKKLGFRCFKKDLIDVENMIIYDLLVRRLKKGG